MIEQHKDISSIINKYDAFLIDLWGVVHDGQTTYPSARNALEELKAAEKTVIFLSNAPKRAFMAEKGLDYVGIPRDLYDHVVTSGEATYDFLKSGNHNYGNKYYIIAPDWDANLLDGTSYKKVESPKDADFIVAVGFDNETSTIADYMPQINEAYKAGIPMICANPDVEVIKITGERSLCAGVMAHEYKKLGGNVRYFGKPYKEVYEKCLSLIPKIPKAKIAAIGDNLETDVLGANNLNIDSYFIAGGILGEKLGVDHGQLPEEKSLNNLCRECQIQPKAVLARL